MILQGFPASEGGGQVRLQRSLLSSEPVRKGPSRASPAGSPGMGSPQGTGHHSFFLEAEKVLVSTMSSLHHVVCRVTQGLGEKGGHPAHSLQHSVPFA